MNPRLNFIESSPDAYRAMAGLERYLATSSIEKPLRELVKMRASQINGCAYCLDMHWKDARAAGETEQRLYGLDAWEEAPYYTDRERAALAWTESLTLVNKDHVPDAVYEKVKPHFSERELADLTWLIVAINSWNRIAIAFRAPAGNYKPGMHQH
jgi:AhpD family alkylhydroperoxidase